MFYADSALNPGFCVERLLSNGGHDLAFNQGQLWTSFGMNITFSSLTLLPGGKLLAVGRGLRSTDTPAQHIFESGVIAARFAANGILDAAYGDGGTWFVPVANSTTSTVDGVGVYAPGSSNYFYVDRRWL